MPLQLPTDLKALVQKRLASGAYASAEEVIRRALEAQDSEDSWTEEERQALDRKIDRTLEEVTTGKTYGPEEARRKLAAMRNASFEYEPVNHWTRFNSPKTQSSTSTPSGFSRWNAKVRKRRIESSRP